MSFSIISRTGENDAGSYANVYFPAQSNVKSYFVLTPFDFDFLHLFESPDCHVFVPKLVGHLPISSGGVEN